MNFDPRDQTHGQVHRARFITDVGFPPVYDGRVNPYYSNTPLWGNEYKFCKSDKDCRVNAGASRCMGIFDFRCTPHGGPCICTNAVNAAV